VTKKTEEPRISRRTGPGEVINPTNQKAKYHSIHPLIADLEELGIHPTRKRKECEKGLLNEKKPNDWGAKIGKKGLWKMKRG